MFSPNKMVYLIYIGIFELKSLVCALAPTSNALIVGRAVSGLEASGIYTVHRWWPAHHTYPYDLCREVDRIPDTHGLWLFVHGNYGKLAAERRD